LDVVPSKKNTPQYNHKRR